MFNRRTLLGALAAAAPLTSARSVAALAAEGLIAPHGHRIIVRKNMLNGAHDPFLICWNDPTSQSWEPTTTNQAGSFYSPYPIMGHPHLEDNGDIIVPVDNGGEFRMTFMGAPFIYGFSWQRTFKPKDKAS